MAVWIGGIFLKDEGGYEIVSRSLAHYKKRLRTISESPELKEPPRIIAPIYLSQRQKTFPMVIEAKKNIEISLKIDPNRKKTCENYGNILLKINQHSRGLQYIKKGTGFISFSQKDFKII